MKDKIKQTILDILAEKKRNGDVLPFATSIEVALLLHMNALEVEKIAQYKDEVLIAIYPSASEAERQTGICSSSIRKVCLGRPKFRTAGGFKWKEV